MKEGTSFEVDFLVSATPPDPDATRVGTGDGGGVDTGGILLRCVRFRLI